MARPHPAVWRVIHGVVVIYLLVLVFLLFQTVGDARQMLRARPRLDAPAARSPRTVEAPCMLPRLSVPLRRCLLGDASRPEGLLVRWACTSLCCPPLNCYARAGCATPVQRRGCAHQGSHGLVCCPALSPRHPCARHVITVAETIGSSGVLVCSEEPAWAARQHRS